MKASRLKASRILLSVLIGLGFVLSGCKKETPPGEEPVEAALLPKPGDVITNSIGMKLVYIPAGSFMMGGSAAIQQHSWPENTIER
jgi:formylglycine-generating enzyme required for sulfatase activity